MINGTRSGSGKIIYEHFDALMLIWGGATNVEPLEFGVDTNTIMDIENIEEAEVTSSNLHNNTSISSLLIQHYQHQNPVKKKITRMNYQRKIMTRRVKNLRH